MYYESRENFERQGYKLGIAVGWKGGYAGTNIGLQHPSYEKENIKAANLAVRSHQELQQKYNSWKKNQGIMQFC